MKTMPAGQAQKAKELGIRLAKCDACNREFHMELSDCVVRINQ